MTLVFRSFVIAGFDPAIYPFRKTLFSRWMPGSSPGMTTEKSKAPYASPSVSNIAALMASVADLPAQTTNWNAG